MKDFETIGEKQLIGYAMKGICERILKAQDHELDRLNRQYSELYQRRLAIAAADDAQK